jgi:hypothetical protein
MPMRATARPAKKSLPTVEPVNARAPVDAGGCGFVKFSPRTVAPTVVVVTWPGTDVVVTVGAVVVVVPGAVVVVVPGAVVVVVSGIVVVVVWGTVVVVVRGIVVVVTGTHALLSFTSADFTVVEKWSYGQKAFTVRLTEPLAVAGSVVVPETCAPGATDAGRPPTVPCDAVADTMFMSWWAPVWELPTFQVITWVAFAPQATDPEIIAV